MSDPVILSLGAGVQSSTLALMAATGEVGPMPVAAVFADTQSEPASVYRWLDWLEGQLPFPVHRVTAGSLRGTLTKPRERRDGSGTYIRQGIPAWVSGEDGKPTPLMRGCTRDYKVRPIVRLVKSILRTHRLPAITQWIGISRDEADRMKDSGEPRIHHAWPLIEARMTRTHCIEWMQRNGYPRPPRSACTFCPYHSDEEWLRLKTDEPEAFEDAAAAEREMQAAVRYSTAPNAREMPFLHPALVPLPEVDFTPDRRQLNLFRAECEGMCGV